MTQNNIITAALFSPNSLEPPNSWIGHLPFASWVIQEVSPKIFVELGTHSGNSYFAFCQSVVEADISTRCYAVDTWKGDEHAGQYNDDVFIKVSSYHDERYAGFSRLLQMTFDDAISYFSDESIELLHIDGMHTYEAVRHDFETWLPKLAPGAVVLFHDTNVRERSFGVWKFWEELQAQYPNNLEFIHSHGLGVLQLNNVQENKKLKWLQLGSSEKQWLINYFAALGARQIERFESNELKKEATNLHHIVLDLEKQIVDLDEAMVGRDRHIAGLDQALLERDRHIAGLDQALLERDVLITGLNQAIIERDGQITGLNQSVLDRDGQIAGLNQSVLDRDGQIAGLNQSVLDRDGQIAGLNQSVLDRDGQIASLNQAIIERDGHIVMLDQKMAVQHHKIAELYNSNSWRITKPFRLVSHLVKRKQGLNKLPKDFNPEVYLRLNPDLAGAGVDPSTHYMLHGRREGRTYCLPEEFYLNHDFNVDKETILVVSHEASRTGAPILSLNIVQAFAGQYNVVVLLLAGGSLTDAFKQTGAAVMVSSVFRGNPVLVGLCVSLLHERHKFKFALVNSIESRAALPALANCFVPSISLLHEFAAYTRPRDAFRDALFWSGDVVFSANLTLENAIVEYPELSGRPVHVLPQGRCLVPLEGVSEQKMQAEAERIQKLVRPNNAPKNTIVVLGAGGVQIRKGVDLFIECAARVVATPEGARFRFVWIGKGYDPDNDVRYSVYLADQISRAGLQEHVFFIDETKAIETAYKASDLLLLSSRLDPLPNVAIDAMVHGLPVLCFNKTTGIADFLIDSGLGDHCVAEYLDSSDMTKKILALADSKPLYKQVAARSLKASTAYFSMKNYVNRLEVLAKAVFVRNLQEQADAEVILSSGLFRRDFYCPPHAQGQTIEMEVRGYIRAWATGIGRRKPFPGFHPGIYLEQHGTAIPETDPFADYLRAGQPQGLWNYPVVIGTGAKLPPPNNQRVALHLHIYYPELLPEIIERLLLNRICPDLFISINNEEARNSVVSLLNNYNGKVVDIQLVPNIGRDIAPLLTAFGPALLANYDFIGHIHTKKSVDVKDAEVGLSWNRFLLENLLGGKTAGAMADEILAYMQDDQSIGMVFPDDPNIVGWSANREIAESLALRVGLQKLPEHFVFPVGTMFWARASALAPMVNLELAWDDYPYEPLPYDGTLLHAIERLFSLTLTLANLKYSVTNTKGLTR